MRPFLGAILVAHSLGLAVAPLAQAVPAPASPLKINGNVYGQFYRFDMTSNAGGNNGFDLDQVHLMATYTFDPAWSAVIMVGALRLGTSASGFNPDSLYIKQAAVIGSSLWGKGSRLIVGQQINPVFLALDVPMNVFWLGYSLSLQWKLQNIFDAGVSAAGALGNLSYSVFVSSGEGTYLRPGVNTNNALSYQGMLGYKFPLGLSLTVMDTYSAGSSQTGPDNYLGVAFISNQRWIDFLAEAGSFTHPDANAINPFPGTAVGPISAVVYGAMINLKLSTSWSLFGRYQSGSPDFQNAFLGKKSSDLLLGPAYTWLGGKLGLALLYDQQPPSDLAVAANPNASTTQAGMVRFEAFF